MAGGDSTERRRWACFLLRTRDGRTTVLTLRITVVPNGQKGTLRLEGRLSVGEVRELEGSVEAGVRALDLQDLLSADEEGLAALRRLRDRGVEIRNPSRYLAMLLG
jgi:hypothetical protein